MDKGDHASVIYGVHFPNRLFVGCLPPLANANDLGHFFGSFGKVVEAKVVLDEQKRSKRFGFVSFSKPEEAEAVLQQGAIYFQGKKINVGPAVKKDVRDSVPQVPVRIVTSTPVIPAVESEVPCWKAKYTYTFDDKSQEPKTPPRLPIPPCDCPPQMSPRSTHQMFLTPPASPGLSCVSSSTTPPANVFSHAMTTSAQAFPSLLPAYHSNQMPHQASYLYVPWSLDVPQQPQVYPPTQTLTYPSAIPSHHHQPQQVFFMPAYVY